MVSIKTFGYVFLNFVVPISLAFPPTSLGMPNQVSTSACRCGERDTATVYPEEHHPNLNIFGNWSRIYGGKDADPGDEKWMAMVTTKGKLCSGSLINDRMVLTAAHCVFDKRDSNEVLPASEFRIWLNRKSGPLEAPNSGSELHYLTKIFVHPEFQRAALRYDAAILVLEKEIDFGLSSSRPICIPSSADEYELPEGTEGIGFGYGRIDDGSHRELPTALQQGSITYLSLGRCVANLNKVIKAVGKDFEYSVEDFDTNICSSAFSKNKVTFTFNGDSGGPVTLPVLQVDSSSVKVVQVGVVSHGFTKLIPQAQVNDPSITYENAVKMYADINRILPFIYSVGDELNAKWCH